MSENIQNVQRVPMPDGMSRPETGPMQFGDDWPGVFIRGDNAFGYAMGVSALIEASTGRVTFDDVAVQSMAARGLLRVLRSCDVRKLDP